MAEFESSDLKNIAKYINDLNTSLVTTQREGPRSSAVLKEFGTSIDKVMSEVSNLRAEEAVKLRVMLELDGRGKTDIKNEIKKVQEGLKGDTEKKITLFQNTEWERTIQGLKQYEAALADLQSMLKHSGKTQQEYWAEVGRLVNKAAGLTGGKKEYSPKSIADANAMESVERLGKKKATIQSLNGEQIRNNELLARRLQLQEKLNELEEKGRTGGKVYKETKAQFDEVNKAVNEYLANLASYGKAGERALQGFARVGLLGKGNREQLDFERQQIDLLRQRYAAEEKLNSLLFQRANANLAGKNISPKVDDSIERLQERITTIDKQRTTDYSSFTQATLQRIEGMWQAHENRLTDIQTQGEASRQRVIDRQAKQQDADAAKQEKELVSLFQKQAKLQQQINDLQNPKKTPKQTQEVADQIKNLQLQWFQLAVEIKRATGENYALADSAKAVVDAQTKAADNQRQTNEAIRNAKEEQKAQDKAESERIKQEQKQAERDAKEAAAAEKQRLAEAAAANKAYTKAQDAKAKADRDANTRRSKGAWEEQTKAINKQIESFKNLARIQNEINKIKHNRDIREKKGIIISQEEADAERRRLEQLRRDALSIGADIRQTNEKYAGTAKFAASSTLGYRQNLNSQEAFRYGQALSNIKKAAKETDAALSKMLPTLSRLASAFGVAFSVQSLVQFGKKVVETRGKFEMQFVAMKQIIGDVDQATKIWNQTMQQALKSPFTAMQLTDYTKKLAAYRIENEKLFDTTKRLADVSAGLGVDMGRLILAYGQVKTANFLRASEVRQFTEAGVNIYGELAKYFSEIEGRAVSTADMVERVSKRMVLFSDVEEIFKRMTDEGGTFFEMQEVQSDTVRGQIQKLHDAYEQMLNSIGAANDGTLRKWIDRLNSLVRNWRDVKFAIQLSVPTLLLFRTGISMLTKEGKLNTAMMKASANTVVFWDKKLKKAGITIDEYAQRQYLATRGMKGFRLAMAKGRIEAIRFGATLASMTKVIWWMAAVEGLILLITKLTETSRAAKRLREDLDNIKTENTSSLKKSIDGFEELRKKIEQTNANTEERRVLVNKINSQYGEYLDNLLTEAMTVEQMSNAYANVTQNMRQAAKSRIIEQGTERIMQDEVDATNKAISALAGNKPTTKGVKTIDRKQARDIISKYADALRQNPATTFRSILQEYFDDNELIITNLPKEITDFRDAVIAAQKDIADLENSVRALDTPEFGTAQDRKEAEARANQYKELEKLENERYEKEMAALKKRTLGREQYNLEVEKAEKEHQRRLAEYALGTDNISMNQFTARMTKIYGDISAYEQDYNVRLKEALGNEEEWSKATIATWNRIKSTESNTQLGIVQRNKQIKESYEQAKESLEQLQNSRAAGGLVTDADINEAKRMMDDYILAAKLRGIDLSDKKKGSEDNSIYADRIRLLQDMLQKFKELSKEAYGYAKAEGKVAESFDDAWKTIMPAGYGDLEVPTSYTELGNMLDRLETFTPKIDKNGKLSAQLRDLKKAVADAFAQADLEIQVKLREDFGRDMEKAFGDYELTLDLQKLNLPTDLMSDLFNVDAVDTATIRQKITDFYNELSAAGDVDRTDMGNIEKYIKKLDDIERKAQRERIKDYAKYLEYELSERAKISMEYAQKIAAVQTARGFTDEQRTKIAEGLERERNEKLAKQDWYDFKGSETYVQMMEDLEKHGTAALSTMREELERIRENAKNLSPRALKEVVNSLEKIREIEVNRSDPFQGLRMAKEDVKNALAVAGVSSKAELYAEADANERLLVTTQRRKVEVDRIVAAQDRAVQLQKELNQLYGNVEKFGDEALDEATSFGTREEEIKALTGLLEKYENEARNFSEEDIALAKERLSLAREQSALATEANLPTTTKERNSAIETRQGEITARMREIDNLLDGKVIGENIANGIIDTIRRLIAANSELLNISPEDLAQEGAKQEQKELSETEKRLQEIQTKYQAAINAIDVYNQQMQRMMGFISEWTGKVNELWSSITDLSTAYEGEFSDWASRWGNVVSTSVDQIDKLSQAFANFQQVRAQYLKGQQRERTEKAIDDINAAKDKGEDVQDNLNKASETAAIQENTAAIQANTAAKQENALAGNLDAEANATVGATAEAATPAVATFGSTLLMAMGWVGLIMAALEALFAIIKAIAQAHDDSIDKQIEEQQRKVDDLKDAYARLEKQIEKTFSTAGYMQTYSQTVDNIRQQIDATQAQMAAEEAKKNTDKNAIRQYQNDIQGYYDQLEELKQKQIEVFGGIGSDNYRSAAEEFVSAWKDAFLETGDGLQGLQDHFDEFLQEWFVKQATMRIAGKMLEPLFKQIDDAVDQHSTGGANVLMSELENVRDKFADIAPELAEDLQELAGMFGIDGEGGLSGLAAGIQGMTEEQANILEAYWNSVRMYTASLDMNVARIAGILTASGGISVDAGEPSYSVTVANPQEPTNDTVSQTLTRLTNALLGGDVNTNPMLRQLTLIAQNTNNINTLLQSVVRSGHSMGGYGIKVFSN